MVRGVLGVAIAFAATSASAQPATTFSGQWRIVRQVDPVTDARSVYAVIGTQEEHLAVGCDVGSRSQIIFRSRRYFGQNTRGLLAGGRPFTYRFDTSAPQIANWHYEDQAAFEDRPRAVQEFIEELGGSHTVYLRATNYDGEAVNFRFTYGQPVILLGEVARECAAGGQ